MITKLIVRMLMTLSIVLYSSGCASKCEPVIQVQYVKPSVPVIDEAKIEQCRYADQLDNVKCVLSNYLNVKMERDQLRSALDEISKD